MKGKATSIHGLVILETEAYSDHRGVFARLFCQDELKECLASRKIVQINHSRTLAIGDVRGLHYQNPPHAEMKFVRCLKGKVWDVAVDLRAGSPTFLKWHAEELSEKNMHMMVIPEGLAHGFQVLEENSDLLYLHTAMYTPAAEGGVLPNDKMLAIDWPLPVHDLSERDQNHPLLSSDFTGIII